MPAPPVLKVRAPWWTAAALCAALAVIHTWPLATAPATLSRNDNGDAQLNEWILAWVAHQLPRAPTRLFAANIFYPARDVLAFSEPLIVPALLGAPVRWLGGSPVLTFNLVMLAGFTLTALAGYTLIVEWTRDRAAGMLAGSVFAFNTHTLMRLPHIQAVHAWGLPMAVLYADRVIAGSRLSDSLWLAFWMTAMVYTSGYLAVFGVVLVAIVVVTRAADWLDRPLAVASSISVAAIVAAIASLPVYLPYWRAAHEQGMLRSLENVTEYSATLRGYVATAGRLHYALWSAKFFKDPVDAFFPGIVVVGLAGCALWFAARGTITRTKSSDQSDEVLSALMRRRIAMLLVISAAGFVLSLGTRTPVYGWLFHVFPPMQGLRAAARFGNLFLLGTAALAGVGLALVRQRARSSTAIALGLCAVVLANLESLRAPVEYARFDGIPRIYSLLASEPERVVLVEAPFYPPQAIFENAAYVLASTAHWRPLMNGYSGYTPQSYRDYAASFWFFPEDFAIQAMRRAGVTHIMVHPYRFYQDAEQVMEKVAAHPSLERVAIGPGGMVLYRLH